MEVEEVDLLVEVDFLEAAGPFLEVHIRFLEASEVDLLVEVDFFEAAAQFLEVSGLLPGLHSHPETTRFSHVSTSGPLVVAVVLLLYTYSHTLPFVSEPQLEASRSAHYLPPKVALGEEGVPFEPVSLSPLDPDQRAGLPLNPPPTMTKALEVLLVE